MLAIAILTSLRTILILKSAPVKAMVSLENTRKIATNLFKLGHQFITTSSTLNSPHHDEDDDGAKEDHSLQSTEYLVHNWLEATFAKFQMIVLWHEPIHSIIAISSILSVFLLLNQFELRLYPTILIAIFVHNLIKVWFRHIWPEIRVPPKDGQSVERLDVDRWTHLHPQLMTLAEVRQATSYLIKSSEMYLNRLAEFRRQKPINFCLAICFLLSCTATIGKLVSGFTLIFCIIFAIILAPGIYLHLLPKWAKDTINQLLSNIVCQHNQQAQAQAQAQQINPSEMKLEQQDSSTTNTTNLASSSSNVEQSMPNFMPILDHLKNRLMASPRQTEPITIVRSEPVEIRVPTKASLPLNDPIKIKNDEHQDQEENDNRKFGANKEQPKGDDLSSNESTSLIDFEDDQDGFVIL